MSKANVLCDAGESMSLMELDDRLYPCFPLESLQHPFVFQARPDDVLLCTYPKSGTHWVTEIVTFLLNGMTEHQDGNKGKTMIEIAPPDLIKSVPSPRFLNTHYHFQTLSPEILRQKVKIIYVTRDPRDVAVSFYNHHKKFQKYYEYEGKWENYFHRFLDGKVDYDSWFEYTKGWEKGITDNPEQPILVLLFEHIKKDPLTEIRKMVEFLDLDLSDEYLQEVVDKTSFDSMKERNKNSNHLGAQIVYRKGITGDWKNWFTVRQSEIFNEIFERKMKGTDAYKNYSHTLKD